MKRATARVEPPRKGIDNIMKESETYEGVRNECLNLEEPVGQLVVNMLKNPPAALMKSLPADFQLILKTKQKYTMNGFRHLNRSFSAGNL